MNNKTLTILLLTVIILGFIGCKTGKRSISRDLPSMKPKNVIENASVNNPEFTTMNISKIDISFNYGKYDFTFRGSIKMIRDSIIVASIMPMIGIEMIRIELTPAEFTVIDKMNRKYTENSYDFIRLKYGIDLDFSHLQAMLSNQIFTNTRRNKIIDPDAFTVIAIGDSIVMRDTAIVYKDYHTYFTINRQYRIERMSIENDSYSIMAQLKYSNFEKFDSIIFPTSIFVEALFSQQNNMTANVKINKIEFDKTIEAATINLAKYQRVTMRQLMPQ
jgi:hypothetical protein